ncbi:MAG: sigma-54-specific transcriptional regulator [Shewanella sp.]
MITAQWLQQTSNLLECKQVDDLIGQFMQTLEGELGLSDALFLKPSVDGRDLVASVSKPAGLLKTNGQVSWDVTDFQHPFSHVLQTAKPMVLDYYSLAYWRDNPDFAALISEIQKEESLLLYPLKQNNHILGLLCFALNSTQSVLKRQDWQQYCEVFMRHWQWLNTVADQTGQACQLTDSIAEIRDEMTLQTNLVRLTDELVGESSVMDRLRKDILRGAGTDLSILVQGETGTGKELVAKAVHDFSCRYKAPFVAINCAAIPDNLLESELFGYEKGAFSGANTNKKGLIAQAAKGTLFLDEIGDMPLSLQSKLLRVLESGHFRALGAAAEVHSDFRLVAATHVNLKEKVNSGEFRRDLYYRLNQFPVTVPVLKDRLDDLPSLINHFIGRFNRHHQTQIAGIRYEALAKLKAYDYPGNVRELRNIIEYACALTSHHGEIEVAVLPTFEESLIDADMRGDELQEYEYANIGDLKEAVAQFERNVIRTRINRFKGDRTKAAMSLGLPKRTFSHKCLKLEINE